MKTKILLKCISCKNFLGQVDILIRTMPYTLNVVIPVSCVMYQFIVIDMFCA